jgi:SAM-dependent methyltransferase
MDTARYGTWEDAVRWLREQPDQQALVRDCYFDDPLLGAAERYWRSEEWQAVRELLPPPGGAALDLGAGNGIASYALARDGWRVTALEPDPSALVGAGAIRSLASESGMDITVLQEWGESIPAADDSFDLVFARQVLHHARDLPQLCREAARVLRRGGTLLAIRDHVVDHPGQLEEFFARHPLHSRYGGENAFTLQDYRGALRSAGFRIRREFGPLDSQMNLSPHTPRSVSAALRRRLERIPGGEIVGSVVGSPLLVAAALRLASAVYRPPGRLHAFLCSRQ